MQGKYVKAIPAATVSANYAQHLFGLSSNYISPLLVAAECYVHLGKLDVVSLYHGGTLTTHRGIIIKHNCRMVK